CAFFSCSSPRAPCALLSFPTRRSSDLRLLLLQGSGHLRLVPVFHTSEIARRFRDALACAHYGGHLIEPVRLIARQPLLEFGAPGDRKSTRLNSSHVKISYAVFCLKKKK